MGHTKIKTVATEKVRQKKAHMSKIWNILLDTAVPLQLILTDRTKSC